jgi:hypothetical protein
MHPIALSSRKDALSLSDLLAPRKMKTEGYANVEDQEEKLASLLAENVLNLVYAHSPRSTQTTQL